MLQLQCYSFKRMVNMIALFCNNFFYIYRVIEKFMQISISRDTRMSRQRVVGCETIPNNKLEAYHE